MIRNLFALARELLNAALVAMCPCGEQCAAPYTPTEAARGASCWCAGAGHCSCHVYGLEALHLETCDRPKVPELHLRPASELTL